MPVTDSDLNLATSDVLAAFRSPSPPAQGAIDATVRPLERTVNTSPLATSRRTLENCRFAAAAEIVFMISKVGFITTFVKLLDSPLCGVDATGGKAEGGVERVNKVPLKSATAQRPSWNLISGSLLRDGANEIIRHRYAKVPEAVQPRSYPLTDIFLIPGRSRRYGLILDPTWQCASRV